MNYRKPFSMWHFRRQVSPRTVPAPVPCQSRYNRHSHSVPYSLWQRLLHPWTLRPVSLSGFHHRKLARCRTSSQDERSISARQHIVPADRLACSLIPYDLPHTAWRIPEKGRRPLSGRHSCVCLRRLWSCSQLQSPCWCRYSRLFLPQRS